MLVLVAVLYYRLQRFYRVSSRMLRRLDSAYKSPVFSLICDCAANAPCLRALEAIPYFEHKLASAIDSAVRVTLSVNIASQVRDRRPSSQPSSVLYDTLS